MKKTFDVIVKKYKLFNLTISGITEAQTLRFITNNTIRIVTQFKQQMKMVSNIKSVKPAIKILKIALSSKMNSDIRINSKILTSFKETLKTELISITLNNGFDVNVKEQGKLNTLIKTGKTNIVTSTILGVFKRLSIFDNTTLTANDNSTLQSMDYTVDGANGSIMLDFNASTNSFYITVL